MDVKIHIWEFNILAKVSRLDCFGSLLWWHQGNIYWCFGGHVVYGWTTDDLLNNYKRNSIPHNCWSTSLIYRLYYNWVYPILGLHAHYSQSDIYYSEQKIPTIFDFLSTTLLQLCNSYQQRWFALGGGHLRKWLHSLDKCDIFITLTLQYCGLLRIYIYPSTADAHRTGYLNNQWW